MDFRQFSSLIMLEQTLFALPFALIGVLFAGGGSLGIWVYAVVALVAARTAGMSFNRVIDARIDAKNPRTKDRLIPKGEVNPTAVWITAVASSLVLIWAAYMLNPLCFRLSIPAVILLFTYSYFKRFSSFSHFYLGIVEAAAPIGGYLAVTGQWSLIPFILGIAIMAWIAGLDIVYALQDMAFDKEERLHSIPVRMGRQNALVLSAASYILSLGALIYAGVMVRMKAPYWIALLIIGALFFMQQKVARNMNLGQAVKTFFRINMFISPTLFIGTFVSVFMV